MSYSISALPREEPDLNASDSITCRAGESRLQRWLMFHVHDFLVFPGSARGTLRDAYAPQTLLLVALKTSGKAERCAVRCGLDSANQVIRRDIQGAAVITPGAIGSNAEMNGPQKFAIG